MLIYSLIMKREHDEISYKWYSILLYKRVSSIFIIAAVANKSKIRTFVTKALYIFAYSTQIRSVLLNKFYDTEKYVYPVQYDRLQMTFYQAEALSNDYNDETKKPHFLI